MDRGRGMFWLTNIEMISNGLNEDKVIPESVEAVGTTSPKLCSVGISNDGLSSFHLKIYKLKYNI